MAPSLIQRSRGMSRSLHYDKVLGFELDTKSGFAMGNEMVLWMAYAMAGAMACAKGPAWAEVMV